MTIKETIQSYIEEGYLPLSSYDEDYKKVEAFRVGKDTIKKLILNTFDPKCFGDYDTCYLIKPIEKYHLHGLDLIDLASACNDIDEFIFGLKYIRNYQSIFIPSVCKDDSLNDKDDLDFFLDDEDVLVRFVFKALLDFEFKGLENKDKLIQFISEIVKEKNKEINDKKYSDDTLSILLERFSSTKNPNPKFIEYYNKNLKKLVDRGNILAMMTIAYDYYNGDRGFEQDFFMAEKYLVKVFEVTKNPNIANTLGYIYYYGRTNNGVIEADKAFKYFAFGHFAGKYYESTYKLADCYLHGYGTFSSNEAAYNLVSSIYFETRESYLNQSFSKYADVALRVGTYLIKGIGVEPNLCSGLRILLEASDAIKIRLEKFEDKFDLHVAFSIRERLDEAKKLIGVKDRTIIKNGYLLEDFNEYWSSIDIKISKEDEEFYRITIIPEKDTFVIGGDESIYLKEKIQIVEYLVSLENEINENIFNNQIESIEFDSPEMNICTNDCFESFLIKQLIYIPQNIKNIDKHVTLATISFYDGGKEYEYYVEENVNVGDLVKVDSFNETKVVKVLKVRNIYEDELPVPFKFMKKAYKI